jgi:predicted outer membrane repeat protein
MHIVGRSFFALAFVLFLLIANPGLEGASSAGPPQCLVSNERTKDGARSLQAAINAAASGDTLIIKGTCFGTSLIGGAEGSITDKDLTLQGVSNKQFGVATLDGAGASDPVLAAASFEGTHVVINDLTITHGGGVGLSVQGSATLTRTIVSANGSSGIDGFFSGVSVTDSTIRGNGAGISGFRLSLRVMGSTVSENDGFGLGALALFVRDSTVSGNGGGGVGVGFGSGTVINSTIRGNGGSGVVLFAASISVESSTIVGNSTSGSGGGIDASGQADVHVSDSTITGNTAQLDGGGINVLESNALVTNSTVSDNVAGGKGGGIHATNDLNLTDSTVSGNTASSGGGIFLEPGGTAVLTGTNTFFNNVPEDCIGVSGC